MRKTEIEETNMTDINKIENGPMLNLYPDSLGGDLEAVADLFEAGGMIIGSSTLNSGMLPTMGSLLVYLKGLNPTGKKAAVFGTYGWAGGAQKDMEALLTAAGFELEPGFTCKWKAQPEDLEAARQLGYEFARKLQK